MPFEEVKKVWMNGKLVDFADAKIHLFTHAIHYGSGLFEGIRCYVTKNQGPAIFRLKEHTRRLYDSAKIYRMEIPYTESSRRKSAVQIAWMTLSMMTVKPKVTSSELNALTLKRANTHCIAAPRTKNAGTMTASVASGFIPPFAESW